MLSVSAPLLQIYSGSYDGTIRVWDLESGQVRIGLNLCGQLCSRLAPHLGLRYLIWSGQTPPPLLDVLSGAGIASWNET